MNKNFKVIIGILISISLIFYLFHKIDFNNVLSILLNFNIKILFLLLFIYIIGMLLRTIRWQLLINKRDKTSIVLIFKALVLGYMINNLLPAKVGELARMEYLKRKVNIGRSFLLGTIFIERLLDVLMVMAFLAFSLIFSQTSRVVFVHNQWAIYVLAFLTILAIYFMLKPNTIIWLLGFFPIKLKEKLGKIISSFSSGMLFLNNKLILIGTIIFSVIIWCLTLLSTYLILRGLGITMPFYAYFFIIAAGVLGMIIPSTSGGIGVYHAIATGSLLVFGVEPVKALSFSIIAHAFDFFPSIILGTYISLNDNFIFILKKQNEEKDTKED